MTNRTNTDGLFGVSKTSNITLDMDYSLDGVTWTAYDGTNLPSITVPAGGNIYLRGNNRNSGNYSNYYTFTMNVDYNIGGNLCSLVEKNNFASLTSLSSTYNRCFSHLFYNDTHLIDASDVNIGNVTTINAEMCFAYMFSGCTSLQFSCDFNTITSINASECFSYCWQNCTSLLVAPTFENLTSIYAFCFSRAFSFCISLETGVDFTKITSIGNTATFQGCYESCSKLSTVYTPNIATWDTNLFSSWLQYAGTQATGTKTVYKPAVLSIPTSSTSGVPTGWTTQNY